MYVSSGLCDSSQLLILQFVLSKREVHRGLRQRSYCHLKRHPLEFWAVELFHMRQSMTHANEKGKEDFFFKKYIAVKLV